jgi:low temperature requirement protein LtrA
MHPSQKKLNEMNRLSDMAHFPAIVNAGATANILLTITLTWVLEPRYPQTYAPIVWIAVVLVLNLLPVLLLRPR